MIKILNVEPEGYSGDARAVLEKFAEVVDTPLSRTDLLREIAKYDVLIVRLGHQVDQDLISAGTRLKAIMTATTGLDHIAIDFAESKGIAVLSLRSERDFLESIAATAEHTWALLLALMRRIPQAVEDVKNGGWRRNNFRGEDLFGKRLGIVGLGRIGRKVAGYGLAFGMKVIAYDPYVGQWLNGVEQAPTLEALLQSSDVLTLHVPLSPETTEMIGATALRHLSNGATLINTSRGEVLDEAALLEALESGRLARAAVDVICNERNEVLRRNSRLLQYARYHTNLVITPHLGGATRQSMEKTEVYMARKLASFFNGLQAV
jgi:D-3-phosphoglycerate dehydrogenase